MAIHLIPFWRIACKRQDAEKERERDKRQEQEAKYFERVCKFDFMPSLSAVVSCVLVSVHIHAYVRENSRM